MHLSRLICRLCNIHNMFFINIIKTHNPKSTLIWSWGPLYIHVSELCCVFLISVDIYPYYTSPVMMDHVHVMHWRNNPMTCQMVCCCQLIEVDQKLHEIWTFIWVIQTCMYGWYLVAFVKETRTWLVFGLVRIEEHSIWMWKIPWNIYWNIFSPT